MSSNTNFIVFGLTRTQDLPHANHYTTGAVQFTLEMMYI